VHIVLMFQVARFHGAGVQMAAVKWNTMNNMKNKDHSIRSNDIESAFTVETQL